MKKILFILVLLLATTTMFGQLTKNVKSHKFESGFEIKEGMTIEFIKGMHPTIENEYIWTFEGGSMPIPKKRCNKEFDGKQFTITKVLSLKGLEKDESIIAMFEIDGSKYYSFVSQSIKINESKYF